MSVQASPANPLVVTFTFDDGAADQNAGRQLLDEHGMAGTFYINSAFIGLPGYMTRADLDTLAANGHEIGGHTVTHQDLPTLSPDEANRQICQDRNTLLSWGFAVTSFAYPYAEFNPAVQATVEQCGYNTARAVGDLRSPYSCEDCPATEPIPPAARYATLTPDDVESTWTLADLQNVVLQAEADGGWLPFNLHHVCDGCALESISPAVFDQFLDWLQPRSDPSINTTVRTVQQVVTGEVAPPVAPAEPPAAGGPGVNTVRNASLETPGTLDPDASDCWTAAGYGTNTATHARVPEAHTGAWAAEVIVTSLTDGDAKFVPTFDLGACSSTLTAGKKYEVSAWYKSDVEVFFTLYQRNAVGQWRYWTQSPRLAPSDDWTQASWVSPVPPDGAVAASFGLTIDSVGTLTTDDYGFAEAPAPAPAPPGVNALRNPSLETAGTDGFPQCWTGTGWGDNTPQWTRVTDAADGTYAQQLELTAWTDGDAKLIPAWDSDNCAPRVIVGTTYDVSVAYKSTAPAFLTLYRQDDATGDWSYWTQSPDFAATESWSTAAWQTPEVPAGTRAVTFGLTLAAVGTLTTDDYSLIAD